MSGLRPTWVEVDLAANRIEARPGGWRIRWADETPCPVCMVDTPSLCSAHCTLQPAAYSQYQQCWKYSSK